jgi:hypothetical protein
VHRHDVRVRQTRNRFDFLKESFRAEGRGDIRVQNLYGDASIMPRIARTIYRRHAAAPDLELDRIAVTKCVLWGWSSQWAMGSGRRGYSLSGAAMSTVVSAPRLSTEIAALSNTSLETSEPRWSSRGLTALTIPL